MIVDDAAALVYFYRGRGDSVRRVRWRFLLSRLHPAVVLACCLGSCLG
jgi:hypothetical protein